ncbi:alpha/beta-hydrolase [Thozetella sp. PMI_491]|nr:alpha/beta-hydrolase [Thozetella sp. PMI_491]
MGRHGTLQAIVLCLAALGQAGPTVTVLNGTYEGYRLDALDQDVFLGMPYAQPPLSVFRFREPQSLNESWNTVKPATQYGAVCYQYPFPVDYAPMSEDCLTINVVRPSGVPSCTKLPVAVWIHGGGLYAGGSASPSYNLTNFVYQSTLAGKPVLGVSINYRLTAFGFLWGSPELTARGSANNGLRDQRMALQWIQENIRAFGGDPSKVTIWGESSGALSVGKHLIAYGGRDDSLFRGAIMQSGGMAEKWPYNINNATAYTEDLYRNLTETTGCNTEASPLECLRSLPIEQMSAALNISGTPVYSGAGLGPWLTVVDGDFLADGPSESLADRHFNHNVTILYTTLTDEISSGLVGAKVDTDADFAALVASAGADEATVRTIEILYPNINAVGLPAGFEPTAEDDATLGSQYKRAVAFSTDAIETSSRRLTVDTWAAAGLTAYSGRPNLKALGASPAAGAFHSADVAFVFNNVAGSQYENPQLQAISVLMSRMWASFVSDLDPNNHGSECIDP